MYARDKVLSWDSTFMGLALTMQLRSKDPSTQVGAVIVDNSHRVMSLGYNGTPTSMGDDEFPWGKEDEDVLNTKYPYVIHAERNAILNLRGSIQDLRGATVYVTLFPCNECMKSIAQSGISRVVYMHTPSVKDDSYRASVRLAEMCGVELVHYEPVDVTVELEL